MPHHAFCEAHGERCFLRNRTREVKGMRLQFARRHNFRDQPKLERLGGRNPFGRQPVIEVAGQRRRQPQAKSGEGKAVDGNVTSPDAN